MSDKQNPEDARQASNATADVDAPNRVAPASKLALMAFVVSLLAAVARCERQTETRSEPLARTAIQRATGNNAVHSSMLALQAMSSAFIDKARQAQGGTLTAADCDHSAYEQFLAARNSLATQLDASAQALGMPQYLSANNQLMALAESTAYASESLNEACARAQPHRVPNASTGAFHVPR